MIGRIGYSTAFLGQISGRDWWTTSRSPEEEEFIATMQSTWEKARKIGHDEGKAEGRADSVLSVLLARGIAVSDSDRLRIMAERDPKRLARWLKKAIVATSASEVIGEERNRA